jgi:hypothetical protein
MPQVYRKDKTMSANFLNKKMVGTGVSKANTYCNTTEQRTLSYSSKAVDYQYLTISAHN